MCNTNKRNLCNDNKCIKCFEKSFASHPRSKQWSIKNRMKPRDVLKATASRYIFDCDTCNHEYNGHIGNICKRNDGCSYCSSRILCKDENCKICYEKSFISHEKGKCFSEKNKISARDIFKLSETKYIFNCDCGCGHEFEKKPASIVRDKEWCPYRAGKILCADNNCQICFDRSFASVEKSKYFSKDNIKTPREITKGSHVKYNFDCPYCLHVYTCAPKTIITGVWCNCLKNKTEAKLYDHLSSNYDNVIKQPKFDFCKGKYNRHLPFDYCIEELKLIIELDGRQHFVVVENRENPLLTQQNDKYKMKCANDNGYTVIRIVQDDVWLEKTEWKEDLKDYIKKYDKPKRIYIGDIYNGTFYNCAKLLIDNKN